MLAEDFPDVAAPRFVSAAPQPGPDEGKLTLDQKICVVQHSTRPLPRARSDLHEEFWRLQLRPGTSVSVPGRPSAVTRTNSSPEPTSAPNDHALVAALEKNETRGGIFVRNARLDTY